MKLKITGLVFATFNPVEETILIELNKNVDLSIKHNDDFSVVSVGENEYYLETHSLRYELVTA